MDWIEIRDMLGLNITPDQLRKISVGYAEYDDYLNGNSGVATTILSISDLHIPFQKPLETFEKYAGKIDVLQLNGDLIDCMALSRFTKTFRVSPVEEMIVCRQYLIDLITMIRPK